MPHRPIPPYQRSNARALRHAMTDVERTLWRQLRGRRFVGAVFRRQVPLGPYIADFVCHAARLVIELDGGQHTDPAHLVRDATRTAVLAAHGYRVLRFWNFEIASQLTVCLDQIYATLVEQGVAFAAELPDPSPALSGTLSHKGRGRLN